MSRASLATGSSDSDRRKSLGSWLTAKENPWFAKALVNRIWSELVGEGFYEPVDDLGESRPCSAPGTLIRLADDFTEHGYEVKWLFRTIMMSDAYQRECRPRRLPDATPFTANVRQPLRADPLVNALTAALGVSLDGPPAGADARAYQNGPRMQLTRLFGYDPSVRREEVTSSIPQTLAIMNSGFFSRLPATGPDAWFSRLLAQTKDDELAITELYLRCFAREPNDQELAVCTAHIKAVNNRSAALEDVFWSLLNSAEMRYRN